MKEINQKLSNSIHEYFTKNKGKKVNTCTKGPSFM